MQFDISIDTRSIYFVNKQKQKKFQILPVFFIFKLFKMKTAAIAVLCIALYIKTASCGEKLKVGKFQQFYVYLYNFVEVRNAKVDQIKTKK